MREFTFWVVFWILLLLPVVLVALGKRVSAVGSAGADQGRERDGVHFARGFAALSSILPVVLLLLGVLPASSFDQALIVLTLYVPILGALSGLCALVLYLMSGRGIERWIGSLASILAVGWLVLMVMAGRAAA